MNVTKRLTLSILFLVFAGFSATVNAQLKQSKTNAITQPIPVGVIMKLNGIEISDGTLGVDEKGQDTTFGYSFLGRVSGAMPGTFTLSMNCISQVSKFGQGLSMTGGTWAYPITMVSIKGESYSGSLYGSVTGGSLVWDVSHTTASMSVTMSIDGGTQTWLNSKGTATFEGYVVETFGVSTLTGTMTVDFQ